MRKFRKLLTNVLLSACGMAFAVPGHAGYKLSDEVKNPTPALLEASEIGVRVFNNKAMQDLPDKDAMVVMSFGTTMKETRDKTINATVAEIQKALPDVKVVVAYTSHIIIDRIRAKEGVVIPTPEEALEQLCPFCSGRGRRNSGTMWQKRWKPLPPSSRTWPPTKRCW